MSARRVNVPILMALAAAGAAVGSSRVADEAKGPVAPARSEARASVAAAPVSATTTPQATVASQAVGGMRVFRDPKTGALREGEHDEIQALEAAGASVSARRLRSSQAVEGGALAVIDNGPEGGVSVVLDESHMMSMVATVGPDGRVSISEGTAAAAEAKVKQARPAVPVQEER